MSSSRKQRRSYTEDYKREAAHLVIDTGRSIAAVAHEINVGPQTLGNWVRQEKERLHGDGKSTGPLEEDERSELTRLRREVFELREDNAFFGKSGSLLRVEASEAERFELIDAQKANYTIARMARLLHVSRAGFYAWTRRLLAPGPRKTARTVMDAQVKLAHEDSEGVYGAPRVAAQLRREGIPVDRKTVARSMRRQGLEGISPRRFRPVTTIPGVAVHHIPDRVGRVWDQGRLDAVWISDITYLRTGEGWLYLCAVRDACSRRVLGWAMDAHQRTDLVERALRMAHTLRETSAVEVVFHADRGAQFTSSQLHAAALELGVQQSVGRTGVCWDNAMSESFWSTLKTEFYNRRSWSTRAEARQAVARWIEVVYNRRRLHSRLGMVPPVEFEQGMVAAVETVEGEQETSLTHAA
ncbi:MULTISPECIES: IS3 family transposase [Micrococcales]|uniref:IS3 family transposase n=1 Tax=Micrococcales TaxID=85006 RepID=UPI000DF45AAD|nr:IS3 family transposase [Brachybacterium alimentarium]RCS76495.1 IS3 family transposase [Brachybacterium alimentarium]